MKFLSVFLVAICGLVVNCHPAGPEAGSSSTVPAPVPGIKFNCKIWEGNYFQQFPIEEFTREAITLGLYVVYRGDPQRDPQRDPRMSKAWSDGTLQVPVAIQECQSRNGDSSALKGRVDIASFATTVGNSPSHRTLRTLVVLPLSNQDQADEGVDLLDDARQKITECVNEKLKHLFQNLHQQQWVFPEEGCGRATNDLVWFGMLSKHSSKHTLDEDSGSDIDVTSSKKQKTAVESTGGHS